MTDELRQPQPKPLTQREVEILTHISDGRNMKEIALHLSISIKTVETHRRAIMEKLGKFTLPELTKEALRRGLTKL